MNLNYLAYFRVLGNTEHYTQAANELNITQPSLSHAIRSLEQDLGTALFEKQGRNVKLTKHGKAFHAIVDKALTDLESGEKQLRDRIQSEDGKIRLAFLSSLGSHYVPSLIKAFNSPRRQDPVPFFFSPASTASILQGIKEREFDLGLCTCCREDADLTFTRLSPQPLIAIVPAEHPLASLSSISPAQLQQEDFIAYEHSNELRSEIANLLKKEACSPAVVCEAADEAAIAGLVSVGYGCSIVPDTPILDGFSVKKLSLVTAQPERSIYLVARRDPFPAPNVFSFYQFLVKQQSECSTHSRA